MVDRRLLRETRGVRGTLGLTFLCVVLAGALALLQAWFLSLVIARVFIGRQMLAAVTDALVALLAIVVLRALVALAGEVAAGYTAARVKADLRSALVDRLLALGPAYARSGRTGELTAAAAEGIEALDAYFGQYLPQAFGAATVPLLLILVVFGIDPISAAILLVTAPLIPALMVLIGWAADALTRRQYDLLGRLNAYVLDVLQGLATLKILGRSRAQVEKIRRVSDRYREATMAVLRVAFLSALALETLASIGTALVAAGVGLRLLYGQMEFQFGLFVLMLAPEVYQPLRLLGARFHARAAAVSASERIFEILDSPAQGVRPGNPPDGGSWGLQDPLCGSWSEPAGPGAGPPPDWKQD